MDHSQLRPSSGTVESDRRIPVAAIVLCMGGGKLDWVGGTERLEASTPSTLPSLRIIRLKLQLAERVSGATVCIG
jgi:hypothetical protein